MQISPYDTALPTGHRPVPAGPRAYRTSLRTWGPLVALVLPACCALAGLGMLRGSGSTVRGVGGFLLTVLAAPALLVLGAPLRSGSGLYLAAGLASALLWLLLGLLASRRATRRPVASWRDFWREYLWLVAGCWVGVLVALVAANLVLGATA
jgi:hypothetical protein